MNTSNTKNSSPVFTALVLIMLLTITVYSVIVGNNQGWSDLYPIFFQNIMDMSWSGQFNLDFSFYLTLSGLWIMWRNKFSGQSIVLGLAAILLGMMAFGIYLFATAVKTRGDIRKLLLGKQE